MIEEEHSKIVLKEKEVIKMDESLKEQIEMAKFYNDVRGSIIDSIIESELVATVVDDSIMISVDEFTKWIVYILGARALLNKEDEHNDESLKDIVDQEINTCNINFDNDKYLNTVYLVYLKAIRDSELPAVAHDGAISIKLSDLVAWTVRKDRS